MREFGTDYLFKVSVEPEGGYRIYQKKMKPYYAIAESKEAAAGLMNLKKGWKIKSVSVLAKQYSGVLFGPKNITLLNKESIKWHEE